MLGAINMAENQEIKVYFAPDSDDRYKDRSWEAPEKKAQQDDMMMGASTKQGAAALGTIAFQLGVSGATNIMNRVGTYTGNLIAQNKLNNAMFSTQIIGAVAMAFMGNPLPIIMTGFQTAVKAVDYQMEITKYNTAASIMKEMTGYSASNRGRAPGGKI